MQNSTLPVPQALLDKMLLLGERACYLYLYLLRRAPAFNEWFELSAREIEDDFVASRPMLRKDSLRLSESGLIAYNIGSNQHDKTRFKVLGEAKCDENHNQVRFSMFPQVDDGAGAIEQIAPARGGIGGQVLTLPLGLGGSEEGGQETSPAGKSKKTKQSHVDHPDFDAFYAAYPRRVARSLASIAFSKALEAHPEITVKFLIDRVAAYEAWSISTETTLAHPATWLNQARWTDDYTLAPPTKTFAAARDASYYQQFD